MADTSYSLLDRLCTGGDAQSWNRLVELYTPVLHAWLRRYDVLSPADVDDLVQDVLLTLSKEMSKFQPSRERGAFRAWLRTILVNRLKHFWRSRQHRPMAIGGSDFAQQLEQLSDGQSQISRLWDAEHDRQVMQRLFALVEPRFAPDTWQAFRRQMLDGVSAESVAAELKIPLHSVYAAKSRVLKALRSLADGLVGMA
jgi:RNA polymerase sigma-70 factor, ECF subfamily